MKAKKFSSTSKTKSLRRLALCVLLIILLITINGYGLTKNMVVKDTETYLGTGELTELQKLPKVNIKKLNQLQHILLENNSCMLDLFIGWHPLMGNYRSSSALLDCSQKQPAHMAIHYIGNRDVDMRYGIYFGRVNDPDISSIDIIYTDKNDDTTLEELCITIDRFKETEYGRYFYAEHYFADNILSYLQSPDYYCYNESGELVYSSPLHNRTSTSVG